MEKNNIASSSRPSKEKPAGDLNLLQVVLVLLDHKRLIAICTAIVTAIGVAYAFLATPIYYSQAVVALKEGKGNDQARLSTLFGGLGGMMASQMGIGNTNLDKIEVILRGHELADSVIRRHDLMPILFPNLWDSGKKAWIPTKASKIPTINDGIRLLGDEFMVMNVDAKKNLIQIGANSPDPDLAKRLVEIYLEELNNKIRNDVMTDAEGNRRYLENQLNNTTDPILIQKIQTMVGMEIEKYMLVSSRAFEVLDPPLVPEKSAKPKRKMIVLLAFLLGMAASCIGVLVQQGLPSLKEARIASSAELVHSGSSA